MGVGSNTLGDAHSQPRNFLVSSRTGLTTIQAQRQDKRFDYFLLRLGAPAEGSKSARQVDGPPESLCESGAIEGGSSSEMSSEVSGIVFDLNRGVDLLPVVHA